MIESSVSDRRESIKRKIVDRKYWSLPETILDGVGKSFQRLTRNEIALPYWGSGILIAIIILLLGTLVSTILHEIHASTVRNSILMAIWTIIIGYICLVGIYQVIRLIYDTLYEPVLNSIESVADLDNLDNWLSATSHIRRQLLFSMGFAAIMTAIFLPIIWQFGSLYPRVGLAVVATLAFFQSGLMIYFMLPFTDLINRLGRYKIRLYAIDPSSSEVVESISHTFNRSMMLGSQSGAVLTFGLVFFGFLQRPAFLIWIVLSWLILFFYFVGYESVLSKIITRTKRAKLNDLQIQIEKLELSENISEQKTMEAINRLIDYHNRIKDTPNSAINIRSLLNFMNSLLLPVIGFFLGNIDTVMKLIFRP
jgi:hypothetical protein